MVPQLILGHFFADYPAQTDWVFARKIAGWPGLLLHGGIVLACNSVAVLPYTLKLAPILVGMAAIHTLQDFAKINIDRRVKIHPLFTYTLDQVLHIVLILAAAPTMRRIVDQPAFIGDSAAWLGAAVVVLTWTYYITGRVALGLDNSYPTDWRWTGKLERLLALATGFIGFIWLAPLAIIPRLIVARSRGVSITQERYLLPDAIVGIVLSAVTGFALSRFILF